MWLVLYYIASSLVVYAVQHRVTQYITNTYSFTPDKASYVACNYVKSGILGLVVVSPIWYKTLFEFDPLVCRFMGVSYGITDFTALFQNKRMARTTVIHHVLTTLMSIYFAVTPVLSPTMEAVVWYGLWSAFAFPVNTYLGLRKTGNFPNFKRFAFYVYLVACMLNWGYQFGFFLKMVSWTWQPISWLVIIIALIRDDIILLRALMQN
jgi:hypothetical protein